MSKNIRLYILFAILTITSLALVGCECGTDEQGRKYVPGDNGTCVPASRPDLHRKNK